MNLEACNITALAAGKPIVNAASLRVASGELVGLIGPNGAGKSTLLKAMLGLRAKDAGEILLDGQDFLAMPASQRARAVAFLPQDRHVEWRLPARHIVMLGRYPHRARFGAPSPDDRAAVARALDAVDGHSFIDRPVTVLSGGERTRVLLARALAVEAPILLADEPIAALDPYHQLHVMEILRDRAHAGGAVLVVIHDLALASRFMDRIVLMHEGSIAAEGKPADVLTPENLARIYRIKPAADHSWSRI